MSRSEHTKLKEFIFLIIITTFSTISVSFGSQVSEDSHSISATGTIIYWPRVDVTINIDKIIGVNNLSLGFQLDWHRWKKFLDRPVQQQLAVDAGFSLVRVFDFRPTSPRLMPCLYWNGTADTSTWNWSNIDALTKKIFEIGAEPLFCLGYARDNIQNYIPTGMPVDPETKLPYPESYAAYAVEWVKHFKKLGLPVRFYEIMNEPHFYFGWNAENMTRLTYFVEFWNVVAKAMRQQNPNILLSHDAITQKKVFDYWLLYGSDVDFLDFHKYDADMIGQYTDAEMFYRAEARGFKDLAWSALYSISTARQKWFSERGKLLPAIISESNFNSAYGAGTDPKIQQMAGTVWLALVLRKGILTGLNYNIYYELTSSKSWHEKHRPMGWGFGMINEDDDQSWYPYYVHKIIGSSLAVGDSLVETQVSSEDIRTIAWIHKGILNILLICKVTKIRAISIRGVKGQFNVFWIDGTISYEIPRIQTGIISSKEPFIMNGYTVALLQMSLP